MSRRGETHVTFWEFLFIAFVVFVVFVVFIVFVVLVRRRAGLLLRVVLLCGSTRFSVCSLLLSGRHDSN
jgi:heme/copper-type cytochrome/quinol oxidase subunit 2